MFKLKMEYASSFVQVYEIIHEMDTN